jgi:hypothetical protein
MTSQNEHLPIETLCDVCQTPHVIASLRPFNVGTVCGKCCRRCEDSMGIALAKLCARRMQELKDDADRVLEEKSYAAFR